MKKLTLLFTALIAVATISCSKSSSNPGNPDSPQTTVPTELRGNWMYGNFSMTEYWSQDPEDYLGNGFEVALAFNFKADGSYTQYFTSSTVTLGVVTYHQSVTQGTVEIDEASKTIITHPGKAHYKRTANGKVEEDRDLGDNEMSTSTYTYTTGKEPNGTDALYLTLSGTTDPLTFLKK